MYNTENINKIIFDAIDELNGSMSEESKLDKSANSVLYGYKSKLDSLGLVNFIVDVEQRVQDEFGTSINLADEKALSEKNSPFLSVKTLSDYILKLLNEDNTKTS
ncbi:MAG: hypothetical protein M3R36_01685 [Bacteroidota bacterium]|nr:hypothetical protein [Bacteroidota bacterium]